MGKICVILNPSAGSITDLDRLMVQIAQLADAEICTTTKPGSAARFARSAIKKGSDLIVAAGGDGTLNEVINGVGEDLGAARVGLLPLGTGNDFARTIGVPTDLEAAMEVIRAGETRAIDLVRVTSDEVRYFVNVSAGGFSGLVDEKLTPKIKKAWGPLAYVRSAAAALPELRAYRTSIRFGQRETSALDLYNVIIANGCYVAVPNRVGHEAPDGGDGIEFWGQSFVVDPAGQIVAKASVGEEEILIVEADLDALDTQRTHWPFFRDRRIDAYGDLQKRFID